MLAERTELLGKPIVVRGDASRFAVCAEILRAVEREAVDASPGTGFLAIVEKGAMGLRRVLDDRDVPILSELLEGLEIHGAPVQVHRDDRLGPGRDRGGDRGGVDQHRLLVDFDEDRSRVRIEDRLDCREERVGDGDDLVAARHAAGSDRELEGVGAATHADRMLGADV